MCVNNISGNSNEGKWLIYVCVVWKYVKEDSNGSNNDNSK